MTALSTGLGTRSKKGPSGWFGPLSFGRVVRAACFGVFLLFLLFSGATIYLALLPWQVLPPEEPGDPTPIHILDYGKHSRLALPLDAETIVEYSVGEWHYYANRKRNPWRLFAAMAGLSRGTLARRVFPAAEKEGGIIEKTGARRSLEIEVSRGSVLLLLEKLEERWRANADTEIYYGDSGMWFVDDGTPYHLYRNSNHYVAEWLEFLGCIVEGHPILSNFKAAPEEVGPRTHASE